MIDKNAAPTKLLWVDLEMTGLDVNSDVILEVAAEITDFNFKTLASYDAIVKQPKAEVANLMQKNLWWTEFPANRDEFLNKVETGKDLSTVENEMIALVSEHFNGEPAVLSGNSIHNDSKFISKYMPELNLKLHYRMLDVSAWKVFMQGKYGVKFEKQEVHRAFDDIQASIAELQYYLDWFNKQNDKA